MIRANHITQKGGIFMLKKIIIIWIGMIFLLLDTKLDGLIFYPAFEPFEAAAPDTVDMIIGHLIGDSVKIDIFSDFIGCLLILIPASAIVNKNMKLLAEAEQEQGKLPVVYKLMKKNNRAFRAFVLGLLTLILYTGYQLMPFVLNGEQRYQIGYFWYIILIFFKCLTFIQAGLICCDAQESVQNHMWNNVVTIFILLSAFAGFVRAMSYFYNLPGTTAIYYTVQLFFGVLSTIMYWMHWDDIEVADEVAH